jgi:formylglycine-generating enzyme required for sulfatase activity
MSDAPTRTSDLEATQPNLGPPADGATKITASIELNVAGLGALVGATWGDFAVGEILGRGGMGAVYRGRQISLDRAVAIKVLPPELAERAELRERFLREARAIAQVASPHIVQVFHAGSHLGWHFYAMELCDGPDLGRRLRDGWRPSAAEARTLVLQAARGLAAAARFGIVHRDIKPANMLFGSDGTLKITDFGLVRRAGDEQLTANGQVMGTASYLSPEQALGKPCDARSDLYSLGCVFYELLSGQPPFASDSVTGVVYQHLHERPEPIERRHPDIDAGTAAVVATLLAKDPGERYRSAADLIVDLEELSAGRSTRIIAVRRRRSWLRRSWPWLAAATVLLAVGAGMAWQGWRQADEVRAAEVRAAEERRLAGERAAAAAQAAAQAAAEAQRRAAEQAAAAREAARRDAYGRFADLAVAGVVIRLRELPPGSVVLGSPAGEPDRARDEVQAEVRFTAPRWIGATEVTQRHWRAVMGDLPAQAHAGDDLPVTGIERAAAAAFCARLEALASGLVARLPSEAEWEFAARAGSAGPWSGGRELATQAWFDANSGGTPRAVAGFPPNPWGIHDLHGNVAEWTADAYRAREAVAQTDPPPVSGDGRIVIKGGAWDDDPEDCRIAARGTTRSGSKRIGFRLLATALPAELR